MVTPTPLGVLYVILYCTRNSVSRLRVVLIINDLSIYDLSISNDLSIYLRLTYLSIYDLSIYPSNDLSI